MTERPDRGLTPSAGSALRRPQRTCVGCRGKADRSVLLRLVAREDAGVTTVVLDRQRRMPGRGLWLHPDEHCLTLATRRKAFGRGLRLTAPVDTGRLAEQVMAMLQDGPAGPGSPRVTTA